MKKSYLNIQIWIDIDSYSRPSYLNKYITIHYLDFIFINISIFENDKSEN